MRDPLVAFQSAVADRYAIEGRLGEGGMAIVFLAADLRHHRAVAVKVLRPEFAAVLGSERFLQEIGFAAELNHPHIVPLFDSGVVPAGEGHPALPYYVMPRLQGETLRERIAREGALPVDEAVEIARQVAQAVAYAHARGIIHRDIKPANILLSDGEAVVADFGIARALDRAGDGDRITDSGLTLGTPAYMAPEQTTGDAQLDGRADIYALGCVLYEMLGGSPPFGGATAAAIIARHRTDAPPSLRTLRSTVPPQLEAVVMRALAKSPADRFQTAALMARALGPGSGSVPAISLSGERPAVAAAGARSRVTAAIAGTILLTLLAWAVSRTASSSGGGVDSALRGEAATLDTTRYAVAPFAHDSGVGLVLNEGRLLVEALGRWRGIEVVDPSQLAGAFPSDGEQVETGVPAARAAAAALDAGHLIHGTVSRLSGTVLVSASLLETSTGRLIGRRSIRIPPTLAGVDSAFAALADGLLLRSDDGHESAPTRGTMSLPARQAFDRGVDAVGEWDLDRADSAFARALEYDPRASEAAVWLAMTRTWSGAPSAAWRSLVSRADALSEGLANREAQVLAALRARASGDMLGACAAWRALTREAPGDFVGWYGWADCQFSDDGVVRDRRSPSGWRFRSSWNSALAAYQRAFELRPAIHRALGPDALGGLRRKFLTAETARRRGDAVGPDTGTFFGSPIWRGDSIALIPYRLSEIADVPLDAAALAEGRRQLRSRLTETAMAWAAAYPSSPAAREVLATTMEMAGDRRALDTLRSARTQARTAGDSARLAAAEVWMMLRQASPGDLARFRAIRHLADSLLAIPAPRGPAPIVRAGLAALTGRSGYLDSLAARGALRDPLDVRAALSPHVEQLVGRASLALGGAATAEREEGVAGAIERAVPAAERDGERMRWLAYSAMLAYPAYVSPLLPGLAGKGDYLVDAAVARGSGRPETARRLLTAARVARSRVAVAGLSMDALPAEAALLVSLGDTAAAIELLDESLRAIALAGVGAVEGPPHAAGFVRAAGLRARLAALTGDTAATRRWQTVVDVLWGGADREVRASLTGGSP